MNAVDTNVLIYAVDSAEPVKQNQAIALLEGLASAAEPVVLLWQVAVEYVSCLRKWESLGRLTRTDTLAHFQLLKSMFECVMPTPATLELSSRYSLSHWDSLLIAACIEAGITTLYSEDLDEGMTYDSVRVVSPFT